MLKWIVVMKIQPSICLVDWGKPRKNPSQVGRYRASNPGPPECESRALPRSHLARYHKVVTFHIDFIQIFRAWLCFLRKNNEKNKSFRKLHSQ